MKNIFVIAIFLSFFALDAAAQNLDPTVEVSRQYEGKLIEVQKPSIKMAVPDSVTRFALDFDYSVFENPYKGSYEFNPYLLSMKPSASDHGENAFYLKVGAGYQLHPTLDLVWSPKFRNRHFNMDVYVLHRSFFGNYLTIERNDVDFDTAVFEKVEKNEEGTHKWSGYDMMTKAGVECRNDWEKMVLEFGAGYYGLMQKDRAWNRAYNAVDADFGLSSKPENVGSMIFDLDVDYRHGQDVASGSRLVENLGGFDLSVGPFSVKKHRISLGIGADVAAYQGAFDVLAGEAHLVPHYVYRTERLDVNLGVKVSKILSNSGGTEYYHVNEGYKEQYVYPDVKLSYMILPESMKAYLNVGGGNHLDTYSSLIGSNHHVTHLTDGDILDFSVERVNLTFGFEGKITDKWSYNLRGGYVNYAHMRNYAVDVSGAPMLSVAYLTCERWFAALDWALDVEHFRFDGTLKCNRFFNSKGVFEKGYTNKAVFHPADLTGDVAMEYVWKSRITGGVDCEFSSSRKAGFDVPYADGRDEIVPRTAVIPGYADLGLYAEYVTARNLSFWLRAGNLLNMTIQRVPLYAEKGVYFTLGICMNL